MSWLAFMAGMFIGVLLGIFVVGLMSINQSQYPEVDFETKDGAEWKLN